MGWSLRSLVVLASALIGMSVTYLVWRFSFPIMLGILLLCLIGLFGWRFRQIKSSVPTSERWSWLALPVIAFDVLFIALWIAARTESGYVSPWNLLPWHIFLAYALSTWFLFLALHEATPKLAAGLVSLHAFASFSVTLLISNYGFGYDPFVHQAAESFLLKHGTIEPRTPLYVGQYVLVTSLARLFHLSVQTVDRWLVPSLVALFVPGMIAESLHHLSRGRTRISPVGLVALFFLPLLPFTFTIPFQLALVFLIGVICAAQRACESDRILIACWLLGCAALFIHPLIGIPALCLVATATLRRRFPSVNSILWLLGLSLAIPLAVVLALTFQIWRSGGVLSLSSLQNMSDSLQILFGVSWDNVSVPWDWRLLLAFPRIWPWLFIAFGCVFWWRSGRWREVWVQMLIASSVGCVLAAVVLALFVRLPNIIAFEQFEFAFRLLRLAPLFFLPAAVEGIGSFVARTKNIWILFVISILAAALATVNWYHAYPLQNAYMNATAPNVGRAEVRAVERVEQIANGRSYLALTQQMMAAAALRQIGFEKTVRTKNGLKHPYAIPTGGEWYARYLELYRASDPASLIGQAFELSDAELVFVAVPRAWDPTDGLRARLEGRAEACEDVEHAITLCVFRRNDFVP